MFSGRAACASCHEVNARGGIVGPDLSNAGRLPAAVLRQKIVNPNAAPPGGRGGRGGATPATAIVKTLDGREIRGVRRNEDTFSLQMIDLAGQLRMFDKRQLLSVVIDSASLHPTDYATRLSSDEIEHLVAYLGTLQARDLSKTVSAPPLPGGVTYERLRAAATEPHNWLMYWATTRAHTIPR